MPLSLAKKRKNFLLFTVLLKGHSKLTDLKYPLGSGILWSELCTQFKSPESGPCYLNGKSSQQIPSVSIKGVYSTARNTIPIHKAHHTMCHSVNKIRFQKVCQMALVNVSHENSVVGMSYHQHQALISVQFFRSSRRVKMSFLCKKGRAATLLLCAFCFKKGNASLDFEQDDYEICKKQRRLLPFPFSSPGRQQVLRVTSLAALKYIYKVLEEDKTPASTSYDHWFW